MLGQTMRLFAAIEIPDEIIEDLAALQNGVPGARWVPEENMHLTLAFFGELQPPQAEDLDGLLSGIAARPFDLHFESVGLFGSPPRTLWAGVSRSEPLVRLAEKVTVAADRAGIELDRRKFAPHVTLARLKDPPKKAMRNFLASHGDFRTEPFTVTNFALFSSYRGKEQAIYTAERYYVF
ncbi:MAG: RNA 2',3'-cyclic phosphodiesterase [Alphaproteobacteria bacterium]